MLTAHLVTLVTPTRTRYRVDMATVVNGERQFLGRGDWRTGEFVAQGVSFEVTGAADARRIAELMGAEPFNF